VQNFSNTFFPRNQWCINFDQKSVGLRFGRHFPQTHLVTLSSTRFLRLSLPNVSRPNSSSRWRKIRFKKRCCKKWMTHLSVDDLPSIILSISVSAPFLNTFSWLLSSVHTPYKTKIELPKQSRVSLRRPIFWDQLWNISDHSNNFFVKSQDGISLAVHMFILNSNGDINTWHYDSIFKIRNEYILISWFKFQLSVVNNAYIRMVFVIFSANTLPICWTIVSNSFK
jgi:hypothetical protein